MSVYALICHHNVTLLPLSGWGVTRALNKMEVNYTAMEKLVLGLVFAAKRLRRYFQVHPIAVIIDQPTKQVISKPEASGRS